MGIQNGTFGFTGSISNLSAYTMRGHDKIIMRMKGGAKKSRIKTAPEFEVTRQLNEEWKAVTAAASTIRNGLGFLGQMADYNTSGPLNALVKKIQTADTVNPKGKRSILFSRMPDFISSFNFNRQTLFDTLIRQPLEIRIDKSAGTIDVDIPQLQPLINFFPYARYAYFRIVLNCTAVSDYVCDGEGNHFRTVSSQMPVYLPVNTPWLTTSAIQSAASYQLVPNNKFITGPEMLLVFGAGLQYGMPAADGSIQPVPYAGAARILKTA